MEWTPRRKSIVFSASLGLLSTAFLTGGVYATENRLDPLWQGFDWANERSLSRSTASLTVLVSSYDRGTIERIAGATVRIDRVGPVDSDTIDPTTGKASDNPEDGEVARSKTGSDGRARFELTSQFGGGYFVNVSHGAWVSSWGTQLEEDVRLGVYFQPDGRPAWREISHKDLEERGGDVARLGVRVTDDSLCGHTADGRRSYCNPAEDHSIHVQFYRFEDGRRGDKIADYLGPGKGASDPHLSPGEYDVITTYKGATKTERVLLLCDYQVSYVYEDNALALEYPIRCPSGGVVGRSGR